jgi:hypothetical protein
MSRRQSVQHQAGSGTGALPLQRIFLWGMLGLLTAPAIWRVGLAAVVAGNRSLAAMQGAAVVHWRRLDEFVPWVVIGVLIMARGLAPATVRQGRGSVLLGVAAAAGVVCTAITILLDQFALAPPMSVLASIGATVLLAFCGVVLAGIEVAAILGAMQRGGANILDIWRFAAAQWGLLMAAGIVYLRMFLRKDQLLGEESVRSLAFMLPAAVLPVAMMSAGILWWDRMVRGEAGLKGIDLRAAAGVPRVRAWIVAFALVNLSGLLLVLRFSWTGIPGALLGMLAAVLYLAGFPEQSRRGAGGKMHLAAWGILLLALGALMIDRIMAAAGRPVVTFYSSAWRHLWGTGAVTLWLIGLGMMAQQRLDSSGFRRRLAQVAGMCFLAGLLMTVAVWLMTATCLGNEQVAVMAWMIAGVGLELGALVLTISGILPTIKRPSA